MAAGIYNISIEQGTTWSLSLAVDSSQGIDLNLTGYTFAAKLAKSHYDDNPVTITTSLSNALEGKFNLSLTAAQTSTLDASFRYIYDVEITSVSGVVTRLIQGSAAISAGVTS